MAKYLWSGTYSAEGLQRLLKEGVSARKAAQAHAVKLLGGTVEAHYFAFGDNDFYTIVDFPDNVSATAISMFVNASGVGKLNTVVLITPEEIEEAIEKTIVFRPPGA